MPEGLELSWRQLGDETLVYNQLSGKTHLLDALSAWVLSQLEAAPASEDSLIAGLLETIDLEKDLAVRRLSEILGNLEAQGLVESDQKAGEGR